MAHATGTTTIAALEREALRPKEAAAALGVSMSTMARMLASGTLKSTKIGRTRLISRRDLSALVNSGAA